MTEHQTNDDDMTNNQPTTNADDAAGQTEPRETKTESLKRGFSQTVSAVVTSAIALLMFSAPALAQNGSNGSNTDPSIICDVKYFSSIIDTAFTLFTVGALVLGLLTWVVTSFTESLPLPQDIKTTLKKQRNNAVASMFRAVFVPAFIIALLDASNIVIPDCINVLPF